MGGCTQAMHLEGWIYTSYAFGGVDVHKLCIWRGGYTQGLHFEGWTCTHHLRTYITQLNFAFG